ncbi:kinase-like domain-containing protein, partial [Mucidula mucida]
DFPRYAFGGHRVKMLNVVGVGRHSRVERAVWRQSRTCLPKFIAVKCIPKSADASAAEIANHAKVSDHEHIVKFYGSYSDTNTVYLKLQLVEGGTLMSAINERNIFQGNPPLVRIALLQLIDAVHYCHEQSVFHGDLKPGNILCSGKSEQFKLLLCDFGSSTDSPTSSIFTERGSEMYASPERLGEEFRLAVYSTKQSDIWSIGIIAINIISSRAPWEKAGSSSSGFNRFLHDPAFLRSTFGVSKDTQAILKRILTLNPMARMSLPNLRAEIATVPSFF